MVTTVRPAGPANGKNYTKAEAEALGRVCRNCGHNWANRPRQLCWTCYYTPGVRDRFPPLAIPSNNRGVPDQPGDQGEPEPTAAHPGTSEKMAVLAARASAGQRLHHRRDGPDYDWRRERPKPEVRPPRGDLTLDGVFDGLTLDDLGSNE